MNPVSSPVAALTLARSFDLIRGVDQPQQMLEPLPYHLELRDYLKSEERELWNWFASAKAKADYAEHLRMELLKSTYRLDRESHPELYKLVDEAKARLELAVPVTLYQAQGNPHSNAALFYLPEHGHIVFSGAVLSLLTPEETKSVISHELAHYHLWQRDGGEFHVADRLLSAVAQDPRAASSHEQSARHYQLYTEIFADRGSLCVTGDLQSVIAGLVKVETGLSQVSATSYLKQAEEIFVNGHVAAEGVAHPESFIRARSLALWQEKGVDSAPELTAMIEGPPSLESLDLAGQRRLTLATRRLIEHLLKPKWFQTPAVIAQAKLYFENFSVSTIDSAQLANLKSPDNATREYFCYVLLDFTKADPELDEVPLAAALELSRQLDMDAQFEKLAARELKMKVRDVRRIKEQAAELLAKAEVNGE
ncbi:MAG TPA: M48 family metalloprotease [Candidatus Dormibacteraeota bacterium]|nr:M48 family metalloprotease [Candidatus Dormibacteraeota bacterium]